MTTSTLKTILDLMVDEYGLGLLGTNTITATTSITDDANLGGPDAAKELSGGSQILVTSTIDGNAPLGEITQLSTSPKLSTGLAKVDPPFTVSIVDTETFIILKRPLRFVGRGKGIVDAVNKAQKMFQWIKRYLPITSVIDGDMIGTAVGDWSATNSAVAKVAATSAKPDRNISVTDSGSGGGYVSPAVNLFVEPSKSYYLEVTGWGTDNDDSGTLQVKDVTNSNAAIPLQNTVIDRMEPEILINNLATPSGCKEVQIRLVADAANDVVSWANIIFRKGEATELVLPDRPQRPIAIGRLLEPNSNLWSRRSEWREIPAKLDQRDSGLWEFHSREDLGSRSVWYEEFVAPPDMTAANVATDTTTIPARDLAPVAAEIALKPLRELSNEWAVLYDTAKDDAAGVVLDYLKVTKVERNAAPRYYPRPAM